MCMMHGRSLALGSAAGCFSVAFAFGCKGQCSYRSRRLENISFCLPGGFRGASCSVRQVCGYGAFLALCWSVCACSLIPAGHPWVNRCVLAERSTHTPHPHHTTSTHHTQPSPPISLHYHSFLSTQVWDGVQFTVCLGCTLCLLIKFDLFD